MKLEKVRLRARNCGMAAAFFTFPRHGIVQASQPAKRLSEIRLVAAAKR
jgi:hypothetical protein